ncbi:hypothetical protein GGR56DRAFT_669678 [Xylariaceae sp. FL0804]|nr:hypothetical protein GGR56DRAFT_669678 [Xylariaceae sp. FL0804]
MSGLNPAGPGGRWGVSSQQLSAQDAEIQTIMNQSRTLFNQTPGHQFERQLGGIHNGTAMLFRRRDDAAGTWRRYVAKVATEGTEEDIEAEKYLLDQMKWGEHIVDMFHLPPDPLTGLRREFFVMEFLTGGTLKAFQQRVNEADVILPNRILWAIFLCLIKGCIEIAWPPRGPPAPKWQGAHTNQLGRAEEPSDLAHRDMNSENIMFGGLGPDEHSRVPIVKLIDFGEAGWMPKEPTDPLSLPPFFVRNYDEKLGLAGEYTPGANTVRNQAIEKNIYDVACTMGLLIGRVEFSFPDAIRDFVQSTTVHPSLDPNLRKLLQQCLAVDPILRPRLQDLVGLIDGGLFTPGADFYPDDPRESDASVADIVDRFILQAATT